MKVALRRDMIGRVRALSPEERARLAATAAEKLLTLLLGQVREGASVALYAATPTEMPSEPAVRLLGSRYRLAYPRVDGPIIRFHGASYESLTAHACHVREPLPTDPEVRPDAIVIPGRAFDRFGVRLGHGAGYYDRTLARLTGDTLLVGYCHSFQLVPELPRESFDRWVHWVVTDTGSPRRCDLLPPESPGNASPDRLRAS